MRIKGIVPIQEMNLSVQELGEVDNAKTVDVSALTTRHF